MNRCKITGFEQAKEGINEGNDGKTALADRPLTGG
jgi:hypothetical protein